MEIYFYLVKSGKNTANQSDEEAEKVSKKMFRQQSSNLSDLSLSNQKSKIIFINEVTEYKIQGTFWGTKLSLFQRCSNSIKL